MDKDLLCTKPEHNAKLDLVCIDKNCPNRGLLCHVCFMETEHHHLSNDIIPLKKFLDRSDKALDQAFADISNLGEGQMNMIRDEYSSHRKILDKCKIGAELAIKSLFEDLENSLNGNYREILKEYEAPKSDILKNIDKSRVLLREMKSGLATESQEISKEIRNITGYFDKGKDNDFILSSHLVTKTDPKPKEKKLNIFKSENKRLKQFLDKIVTWCEAIPSYDIEAPKPINQSPSKKAVKENKEIKEIKEIREFKENKEIIKENKEIMKEGSKNSPKKKKELIRRNSELDPLDDDFFPQKKVKPLNEKNGFTSSSESGNETSLIPKTQNTLKKKSSENTASTNKENNPAKNLVYVPRLFLDEMGDDHYKYLDIHAITFKSDKDIYLRGFGHWMIKKPSAQAFFEYALVEGEYADEEEEEGKTLRELYSGNFKLTKSKGTYKVETVLFENNVRIRKDILYTLKVVNKTRNVDFYCYKGIDGLDKSPPFTFYQTKSSDLIEVNSNVRKGQIPEFLYYIDN